MQYTYYGSGEIKVLGSAKQFRRLYIYHKYDRSSVVRFKQKDIAYIKRKAELGILEKIVIEREDIIKHALGPNLFTIGAAIKHDLPNTTIITAFE